MKRLIALAGALVLVLAVPAEAQLSKANARLAAESAAYRVSSHKTWSTDTSVGACRRLSAERFDCEGSISGDQFQDCAIEPFICTYVFHECTFTVGVHQAGYSALGRVRGIACTAREHTG